MTQNTEFPAYVPPPPAPRPPLRRSQSDRVLGGVAAGFARWLGIDPVIVRVVLVVLAVFGGSGLLLYLIGWLFIPEEGAPSSQAEKFIDQSREPNSTARTVLIVIGIVVGVILFANLVGALFGGWGGSGSVVLLLAVGALVLYLANRRPPGQVPVAPVPPAMTSADPTTAPLTGDAGTTAVLPSQTGSPAAPAAYAYGGSGQYPGYVAPQPTPLPPTPRPRSYLGLATLSIALLVTGVLVSLQVTGLTDFPPVIVPAVALAILGTGVLVGAWVGRARWLLWFAIPTLFVTMIVSFIPAGFDGTFDPDFRAGVGEKFANPVTVVEAARPHDLGVGSLQVDLTDLQIPSGVTVVPVEASVGLGELVVIVPEDARVLVDANVQLGELRLDGVPRTDDPSPSFDGELPGGSADGPVIDLTLQTTIGAVEVSRA